MYLSTITIANFRCFGDGDTRLELRLRPGLTALVGENDTGKSAVIDALRFVLGTTDQEWYPHLEPTDFHHEDTSRHIKVVCRFEGLNAQDTRAFLEYLTYGDDAANRPVLFVNWTAEDTGERRKGQPYRRVEVCSGKDGDGPPIDTGARDLLRATYLRPLRDAEQALSAGRGSRLAQVLRRTSLIAKGDGDYDLAKPLCRQNLSVLGIAKLADDLLKNQKGIQDTRGEIDDRLGELTLHGNELRSDIRVGGANASDDARLRELLGKLDLRLVGEGRLGLGSNNLLFIACELLLLAQEEAGNRLILIEEPEAHLHAQRQLRVMRYLQTAAAENQVQVIVTTHSPNLASAIPLDNLVMMDEGRAFSMAEGQTQLQKSDYRFLERFLDVTKANLFFARGVLIVEGDAENILLPTLARLIGRELTAHGVSIVNVGGVGLRRYARVFQRAADGASQLRIPVACLTDMDVMPDCAPAYLELEEKEGRRWKRQGDFDETELSKLRSRKEETASGQSVRTFVSDHWTFEYDLALGPRDDKGDLPGGLAEDVFVAACLAREDDAINTSRKSIDEVTELAEGEFQRLSGSAQPEVLASQVYARFARDNVSKPVAAQYLAERLRHKACRGQLSGDDLRARLPRYLVEAIDYVTRKGDSPQTAETGHVPAVE